MSNVYRIHGARFLRKYTAADKSSAYSYMADVRKIADSLCKVPWTRVVGDVAATTTIHTEEGLDWNEPERERFDAAEWCGEHSDGFHRAFAQAACYVFKLPTTAIGKTIQKIRVNVTSDPYNPYGARIAALTSTTLNIPMDCDTVRGGDVHRAPDSDGMGAAPRLFKVNADGTQTWYANSEIVDLVPGATLAAKQYLFVFVSLENYNRGRDGWIEGSSYIDNDVELTLSSAATDLDANELNDLTPPVVLSEFNVCRGGVLPRLSGGVSGIQAIDVGFDGLKIVSRKDMILRQGDKSTVDEDAAVGLRTAYGLLFSGQAEKIDPDEYGLKDVACPGAAFSVCCRSADASVVDSFQKSNVTNHVYPCVAYGDGVFVAGCGESGTEGMPRGLWYSVDDGRSWTQSAKVDYSWGGIAYGDGVFVAGSADHGLWYSTDGGKTWTQSGKTDYSWESVAYGDGVFVAGSAGHGLWYSTDGGRTWTQSAKADYTWNCVAYGDGVFVAGSTDHGLWHSTDGGRTWAQSNKTTLTWDCVAYGGGVFVAGGYVYGTGTGLWRSTDKGKTWSVSGKTGSSWESVAYGNGVFVAGGYGCGLWRSTNGGSSWSAESFENGIDSPTSRSFASVAYGDGVFVAGSEDGIGLLRRSCPMRSIWKILTSVVFVRTSVPIDFKASKVRLDWSDWTGVATSGAKFNVWMKRGAFADGYPEGVVGNHAIYDCTSDDVDGYKLVGTIDAASASKTATLDLKDPLGGEVATFLLSAYVSMDRVNPSSGMTLPLGVAKDQYVDMVEKTVYSIEKGWKPDITLLG